MITPWEAAGACPYLARREGGLFVCARSGKPVDALLRPCLLPRGERRCPLLWGEGG